MKNKKVLMIVAIICFVLGVGTCFAVAILSFGREDLEVRIERAGVCNPLKPVEEKELSISDEEAKKLGKYWSDTNKDKTPGDDEVCDCIIGDYKLFVGEDEILFNLDLGYVSFGGKEVDISDEFHKYLSKVVKENDIELNKETDEEKCCSCCPDAKPGETCIDACCPCS